jgi:hypothetical protein
MMRRLTTVLAGAALIGACTAEGGNGLGGDDAELTAGTRIATTATGTVSSETNGPGDHLVVRVARDVSDSTGTVVIPAGAEITLTIREMAPAPNKGEKGTLTFSVGDITINGETHDLDAEVVDYAYAMKGTGVGAEEVGKTAAGGVAGAIIGRTVGGEKGTIPGANWGGAAGAAIADYSQDRNIVVAAGNRVTLELTGAFDG